MFPRTKKYFLEVCIYHDSDFGSQHFFFDMFKDNRDVSIWGYQDWNTKDIAIKMATQILSEIRDTMSCKEWLYGVFRAFFGEAINSIQDQGWCNVCLGGNYEGTYILFNTNF